MWEAILLGFVQGVTEWLPVSSEGVITAVHAFAFDNPVADSVAFALWLHLGTVLSALVALRRDIVEVVGDTLRSPLRPTRLAVYLVAATLISGVVGFPLLLGIDELSGGIGAAAMGVVGALMLITGGLQLRRKQGGTRTREDVTLLDAALTGIAQGFAALPGLSRSGLTVSALLARHVDRREALTLSFLLSIPASLGGGLYSAIDGEIYTSGSAIVAVIVAAIVGFVTIRALMNVAERVNFGLFVILVGLSIIGGSVWQGLS
ncbi:MAG: undecaprenyl-diphosphate phosphatase [SAR202 cluster bacterium]|jgi:undecaprenyl-diphosphatase|nr:undecaprenyl-diphosphate phosphatase [SAR202 cluster bacterium]